MHKGNKWLPEPGERTVGVEGATGQQTQPCPDEPTAQQGRSWGLNKDPDPILLLPSDLLPVLPQGKPYQKPEGRGHCKCTLREEPLGVQGRWQWIWRAETIHHRNCMHSLYLVHLELCEYITYLKSNTFCTHKT